MIRRLYEQYHIFSCQDPDLAAIGSINAVVDGRSRSGGSLPASSGPT